MCVLLEESNGFNDVTQFEMFEEAIGKMHKIYETDGDKRVRNSVDFHIQTEIKTM